MRRKFLNFVWHLNERTDSVAAIVTAIYVLIQALERFVPAEWVETYAPILPRYEPHLHIFLVVLEVLVAVLIVAYWLVRFTFRNPNRRWLLVLTKNECDRLMDWLSGTDADSQMLCSTRCLCQCPDETAMDELATMNFNAFAGTAYEATLEQFRSRNAEIVKRNPKCFMFFIDPIEGKELVGYSCLLPLNALGTKLYLDGSISDASIPSELIATAEELPVSILVFAIHLHPDFSLVKNGAARKYTLYFWSCVCHHITTLCGSQLKSGIDFYVQTQERSLRKRLINKFGFIDENKISRDGYPILHKVVKIPGAASVPTAE